jgi:diguanylate cyclase (GGDEF)-like protein/PAS domain S-box-containing protein
MAEACSSVRCRTRSLRALLIRSLHLFLPIAGGITLVLLPMVALYEQSRRETLQARVVALVQAGSLRVQAVLHELHANTSVIAGMPALHELLVDPGPPPDQRNRIVAAFRSQLQEYERFQALAVYSIAGQPLTEVSRTRHQLIASELRKAQVRAMALKPGQIWLSTVLWPGGGPAELLLSRPLFSEGGERRGVLLAVVSLAALARDFNLITNTDPSLQRGYLLNDDGRTINAAPAAAAGMNFAARYPQVWQTMQRQAMGVVDTSNGLFVYLTDPLRPPALRGSGEGLFVFDSGRSAQHLAVVIQVPPNSLYRNSAFAQPAGQTLVVLLYVVAAGASLGVVRYQKRLEDGREQERQLQVRLQTLMQNAGVGMCLCDSDTGHFLSVNSALCRFFGRSESELLACTWQTLTHPEDLLADQRLANQLQHGELDSYRLRKRFLRPDGSSVWGDLVVACSRNADGTIRDLIGQISDVSELVAKSTYLAAASSAGVVGVWDWDMSRDILTSDAVTNRLYGLKEGEFQRSRAARESALHPDDKGFVEQELQAALQGWREFQPRFRVVWTDDSVHVLQTRSQTSYGADGIPLRMIGVSYDITEQVRREQEVEQQRKLLATILDALVDPLLFITLEDRSQPRGAAPRTLCIAELNPAAAVFFSRSQAQLLGQPLTLLLPESLNQTFHSSLLRVVHGGPPLLSDTQPVLLREGEEPLVLDVRAVSVRDGLVLSFRDVSEPRRIAQILAASEERFRMLAENVTDVVFLSEEGLITWMAPGITAALGWAGSQWLHRSLNDFCHPQDRELVCRHSRQVETGEQAIFRLRLKDSNGSWHWVEMHAGPNRWSSGQQRGTVASFRIIDQEMVAEAELDRRARTDPLSGLLNRQEILERLEQLAAGQRQGSHRHGDGAVAVLFCDLDNLKAINDNHGHGGGDAVLRAIAERLRHCTRRGDLIGRIGGDELLVVLKAIPSLEAAVEMANKVRAAVHQPLLLPAGELIPTLSIGVTLIQPDEPIDSVVARADRAMYEAKQGGRDRVVALS